MLGGKEMCEVNAVEEQKKISKKSRLVALLLCFFLGWAGAHRFYTRKIRTGIMMNLTMGGFGIWYFIDLVMIALGVFKDSDNLPLRHWGLRAS